MSILLVCACISITPLSRRLFDGSVVKAGRETGIVGGDEFLLSLLMSLMKLRPKWLGPHTPS